MSPYGISAQCFRQILTDISAVIIPLVIAVYVAGATDLRGGIYGQSSYQPQPFPLFGARVELLVPQTGRIMFVAYTGPDGMYYMTNIPPGSYQLRVNQQMRFPVRVASVAFQDIPPIRIRR